MGSVFKVINLFKKLTDQRNRRIFVLHVLQSNLPVCLSLCLLKVIFEIRHIDKQDKNTNLLNKHSNKKILRHSHETNSSIGQMKKKINIYRIRITTAI